MKRFIEAVALLNNESVSQQYVALTPDNISTNIIRDIVPRTLKRLFTDRLLQLGVRRPVVVSILVQSSPRQTGEQDAKSVIARMNPSTWRPPDDDHRKAATHILRRRGENIYIYSVYIEEDVHGCSVLTPAERLQIPGSIRDVTLSNKQFDTGVYEPLSCWRHHHTVGRMMSSHEMPDCYHVNEYLFTSATFGSRPSSRPKTSWDVFAFIVLCEQHVWRQ